MVGLFSFMFCTLAFTAPQDLQFRDLSCINVLKRQLLDVHVSLDIFSCVTPNSPDIVMLLKKKVIVTQDENMFPCQMFKGRFNGLNLADALL